jgi:predicted permease
VFAAGLFVRTFQHLANRDLGFDQGPILLANLDSQRSTSGPEQRAALFARVREAAAALPGVSDAAVSTIRPVSNMGWNQRVEVEGGPSREGREQLSWFNAVTPGYFRTYRTPLLAGRDLEERDRLGAPAVAVVNETFVRRFCACPSPLGRRITRDAGPGRASQALEVVGVVEDAAYRSPREAMEPVVYVPIAQRAPDEVWPFATLAVRSAAGPPAGLIRGVAQALAAVDPQLSLTFQPLAAQLEATLMRERMLAQLSGFFGALSLLLAGIGLYGVTAYSVSRRRGEIGVRMALGADAALVVRLVLRSVLALVALGMALGAAVSLWAARFASSLLYGLEPHDPLTLALAGLVLVAVSLLAAGLPARDAARIDPAGVLREG